MAGLIRCMCWVDKSECFVKNLIRRLAALEKGFITEPTTLTMPDGSMVTLNGQGSSAPVAGRCVWRVYPGSGGATGPDSAIHGQPGAGRRTPR